MIRQASVPIPAAKRSHFRGFSSEWVYKGTRTKVTEKMQNDPEIDVNIVRWYNSIFKIESQISPNIVLKSSSLKYSY